jgi:phosphatidylglycerol:prolipoprotein diacylglycerol transferase
MFMGGLIGAIICGGIYIKIVKLNFWQIADLLVFPTLLGIGLGRIGCILINDHQGAITSLPWGILWPDGIVRHPVAIYESLTAFGLLVVFWALRKYFIYSSSESCKAGRVEKFNNQVLDSAPLRSNNKVGQLFLLFLFSYSALRFFLDFTREASGPLVDPRQGLFSISQWIAGVILLISFVLFVYKRKC